MKKLEEKPLGRLFLGKSSLVKNFQLFFREVGGEGEGTQPYYKTCVPQIKMNFHEKTIS